MAALDIRARCRHAKVTEDRKSIQEDGERRSAGRDLVQLLAFERSRWPLDEAGDKHIVMLAGRSPMGVTNREIGAGIVLEPRFTRRVR